MDRPTEHVLDSIVAIEGMAEDVLADKQQLVDLDRKRQKTRTAVRVLQKDKTTDKKWVCFGNMFIKMPKQQTVKLLDTEFDKLDDEINAIRTGLKTKVNKLRDLEHKELPKGFHLTALTREEIRSLEAVL